MMMGPTKKKVFSAGLICFLIPVILGTIFFMKYKKEKDHYRLQPENSSMDPIIVNEVIILGRVVGLFRLM